MPDECVIDTCIAAEYGRGVFVGPISLLIKPAAGNCNLRCRYCFYRSLSENLSGAGQIMDSATMEKMLDRVFDEQPTEITLAFQGGEPTLAGLGWFEALVRAAGEKNRKHVPIHYAMQTNGMLLDESWAAFLKSNGFLIGLSLDGTREIHDDLRPKPGGKGSFTDVLRAARLMDKFGVPYNILCVVTNRLARHADAVYAAFKKNGFRYLQFIPCLDPFGEPPEVSFAPSPGRLGEFYVRLFDLWYRDLMAGEYVSIRWFDNLIRMAQGGEAEMCGLMGYCPGQLVIEGDGSCYPCDFYVTDRWRLGNLHELSFSEMAHSETMQAFVEESFRHAGECEACAYRYLCRGGCRRDKQHEPGGEISKSRLCESYQMFFAVFMPRLGTILRKLENWNR